MVGLFLALVGAGALMAAEVEQAWDFDLGFQRNSSTPRNFAVTPSALYFVAENHGVEREIWMVPQGGGPLTLLRDLEPEGGAELYPAIEYSDLVASGDRIFFSRTGRVAGCRVWTSNGTASGTLPVADLCGVLGPLPDERALLYDTLDKDLWVSDGTREGTAKLEIAGPDGDLLDEPVSAGANLFFTAGPFPGVPSPDLTDLWVSDGSEAGTFSITAFRAAEENAEPAHLQSSGSELFFFTTLEERPIGIWKSDGTEGGTVQLGSFLGSGLGDEARVVATAPSDFGMIFALEDPGNSCSLWRSDGSSAGTYRILEYSVGLGGYGCVAEMVDTAAGLFFSIPLTRGEISSTQLWATDGSSVGGTRLLREWSGIDHRLYALMPFDDKLLFIARQGRVDGSDPQLEPFTLWTSDGTVPATQPVIQFGSQELPGCSPDEPPLTVFDSLLYYCATDEQGSELRGMDGGNLGIRFVANLAPDIRSLAFDYLDDVSSAFPLVAPASSDTQIFFVTSDRGLGQRLWGFDETTGQVEELANSSVEPDGLDFAEVVATPERAFFKTHPVDIGATRFWVSDGTAAGTRSITSAPEDLWSLEPFGDGVCFSGSTRDGTENELWCSDGTEAGTRPLGDLFPPSDIYLDHLTQFQDRLLFTVRSLTGATELWLSDGTAAGTRILASDFRGGVDEALQLFTQIGDDLFFLGGPPEGASEPLGLWVWRIVGDSFVVEPVSPVFADSIPQSSGAGRIGFRGRFVFTALDDDMVRLFSSDGTATGIRQLAQFPRIDQFPRVGRLAIRELTAVGNDLYFVVYTEELGEELWATDGTAEGTRLVRDIAPGVAGSIPRRLTAAGSTLLFTASDGVHGFEPWASDGTTEGTRQLVDLQPGPESSTPAWYETVGDRIVFNGWTRDGGGDLWAFDLEEVGSRSCEPRPGRFCLGEGRYEILADWRNPRTGEVGRAFGEPLTSDTGQLWFFDSENLEVITKILDGGPVNGFGWFFYGSLTDLGFWLSAVDLETGVSRTYVQKERETCGGADVRAFPMDVGSVAPISSGASQPPRYLAAPTTGACAPDATTLCLLDGRFQLRLEWSDQRRPGRTGDGMAVEGTDQTGYFWFFQESNLELMVKVLDGRPVNGNFWVFYGSLTDVEFTMTVTDTVTGAETTYHNEPGNICGRTDTAAFEG
ncbi:MAG: hypothetical protein SX243_17915 [Acidobacteriota bacterium]|nr:hypothetical protein [Acidobacteriota bacterium]